MKKIFTKNWMGWILGIAMLVLGMAGRANAQDTKNDIEDNKGVTAICTDGNNNVFVLRDAGSSYSESGNQTAEVEEYSSTGSFIGTVISNAGTYRSSAGDYTISVGLAVDAADNLYVCTYNDVNNLIPGNIVKYTKASNYVTSFILYQGNSTYGYFGSLAMDSHGNLYTVAGNFNAGTYQLIEIAGASAASSTIAATPKVIDSHAGDTQTTAFNDPNFTSGSGAYVPFSCLAIDGSDNIYMATAWGYYTHGGVTSGYDGGTLYKYIASSPGTYGSGSSLKSSFYGSALGVDPAGEVFATVLSSPPSNLTDFKVVNYGVGATGSATTVYSTGLSHTSLFPWGLVAINSTDIFIGNGTVSGSGQQGDLYQLFGTPTTTASGVSFSSTTSTSTNISWTNGSGSTRAVFMAALSSGAPGPVNGTAYTANSAFGTSGTQIGSSGWYCVYNSTGTSVSVTGLSPTTTYRVMVVEYNGGTGAQNYNTATTGTNNPNNVTTATPTITTNGSYSSMSATVGSSSSPSSITVSGTNLTANITATVNSGFDISLDNVSWSTAGGSKTITQSGGSITNQTVYVRLDAGDGVGFYTSGNVALTSTSATTVNVPIPTSAVNNPSTTISSLTASTSNTNASSVTYTATFAASVSGLTSSDFGLSTSGVSGASIGTVSGSGTSWTIAVNTGSGNGTVQLVMNGTSGVTPSVSNVPFSGTTVTVDKTAPTIAIGPPSVSITAAGPVSFTVTYSDANFNSSTLTAGNISLNGSGATASSIVVSGSGTTRTVTLSGITGNGTLGISIAAGTATDLAGNSAPAAGPSTTFTVDNTAPTVSSITATTPTNTNPTNATTVVYTVTFSESVTGVDLSDFSVVGSGVSGVQTNVTGSGTTWTVTVGNVTGTGTLGLNVNTTGDPISDAGGNLLTVPFTGDVYTIDQTAPTVSSITATTPTNTNPTNATTVVYTVTFSESVTGVDLSDFAVVGSGVSASLNSVTGSGTTWTVTLTNLNGNGTIGLNFLTSGDLVRDAAGNFVNTPFTGDVYTIDQTAPTAVSLSQQDGGTTVNQTQLDYQLVFSEDVTGVDASDFTIVASGVTSDPVSVTKLNGHTYNVSVSNVSGNGTFQINLNSSGTGIADLAGNPLSGGVNGDTFTVDQTAPTVSSITATTPSNTNPTNATSVSYTVTFSEPVQGVAAGAFTGSNPSGSVSYSSIIVSPVSSSVYTVTIAGLSGDGTVRLDFTNTGSAVTDAANNAATAFSSGDVYTIDNTAPLANTLVYKSNNSTSQLQAVPGDVVTLSFTTSETIQTPTVTIGGNTVTATNTSGNDWTASYTVTSADPVGRLHFSLSMTDIAGNTNSYNDIASGDDLEVLSTDATLLSMNPQYGPMSPAFRPLHFNYNLAVGNNIKTIWVAPVADNAGATITVNGSPVSSGTQSSPIVLNEGATTSITVVVTAQDGVTSHTYTIHVSRASSADATLSFMGPSKGRLTPFFSESVTSYTLTVNNIVTDFSVTPTTVDPNSTIKVNGVTVASGTMSQAIALTAGQTTNINVVVTAQDGSTTKTYTIAVTRPLSSNATLSALGSGVTPLIPTFAPGTNNYAISVPYSKSSTTVTPTAADPNATIKVNGTSVTSGSQSGQIALAEGTTTNINIVVTAQDGSTNTYTIAVTRGPSTNANLTAMGPSSGPLSPVFAPGTTSYTLSVPNSKPSVTVTPVTADANATITVNGTPLASGTTSDPVALTPGVTSTITVVVTAQDGSTSKTYSIDATRALSSDATLSAIGPQYGPLSPVFTPGNSSYAITVANSKSSFTVTPVAHDPNSTITVNGTAVTSGNTSDPVALTAGSATNINVAVTAQDGTINTYTIAVTRQLSSDANLSAMGPQYGPLTPAFQPGTTSYSITVDNSKSTFTVTPVAEDANATITVDGMPVASGSTCDPAALTAGAVTNITVVATAQDGTTSKTYTIAVTRLLPNDAALSAIGPQYGPLTPVFSPGTTSYSIGVANTKTTFTVTPVAHDPMATITVNGTAVASGSTSDPVALTAGANTNIVIVVTAQDGTTTNTYTVAVNRAPGSMNSYPEISVTKPAETVTLAEDGIKVHQGISPNGDGIDDVLQIDNISQYPDNHLKIMNRNGELVFEAKGYDNISKVFDGHSNKNGKLQLPGTYFFQLEYTVNGASRIKTGYLVLKY